MNRERRAYICEHADHLKANMAYRVFLSPGEPVPKCPEHGRPLVRQTNRPYKAKANVTKFAGGRK